MNGFTRMQLWLSKGRVSLFAMPSLLALFTFALTAYLSIVVYRGYPFTHDEYVNKYQAEIFASGMMKLPANINLWGLFEVFILKDSAWNIFSKYPPGFSGLLAIGVKLGIPTLVNPLITAGTILFIFYTLKLIASPVVAASLSALVAINSYFLGYGGSYFAQPLALCLVASAFYFFSKYMFSDSLRSLQFSALSVALLVITRPLDAFCLLVAFLATLLLEPRSGKRYYYNIATYILFFACGTALLLLYNYRQSGCICIAMYPVWDAEFKVVDPDATSVLANLRSILGQYADSLPEYMDLNFTRKLLPIIGAHFLILALIGIFYRVDTLTCLSVMLIIDMVLLYNFHQNTGVFRENSGWPQYGTRYWYPLIAPLSMLAARGLEYIRGLLPRPFFPVLLIGMALLQLVRLNADMQEYGQRFADVARLNKIFTTNCPPYSIITLFKSEEDWFFYLDKDEYITMDDFKRNAFFNGKWLVVSLPYQARDLARYARGKYSICNYFMPPDIMKDWHPERRGSAPTSDDRLPTD